MFGRGLEEVDYKARGEGCEGSQQKVLSLLHHRAPSSLGGLMTADSAYAHIYIRPTAQEQSV